MADEQKQARQALSIIQQSITEFMRFLKGRLENAIMKHDLTEASQIEDILYKIEESPNQYTIARVESGKEQEFRDLLQEHEVTNYYVNAPFMESYNGSWIIPTDQYELLIKLGLISNKVEERIIMTDEEIENPEEDNISDLVNYITFYKNEAASIGDEEAVTRLNSLLSEIDEIDNPIVITLKEDKIKEFFDDELSKSVPPVQISDIYLERYNGRCVIPRDHYKLYLEKGLIYAISEQNHEIDYEEETDEEHELNDDEEEESEDDEIIATALSTKSEKIDDKKETSGSTKESNDQSENKENRDSEQEQQKEDEESQQHGSDEENQETEDDHQTQIGSLESEEDSTQHYEEEPSTLLAENESVQLNPATSNEHLEPFINEANETTPDVFEDSNTVETIPEESNPTITDREELVEDTVPQAESIEQADISSLDTEQAHVYSNNSSINEKTESNQSTYDEKPPETEPLQNDQKSYHEENGYVQTEFHPEYPESTDKSGLESSDTGIAQTAPVTEPIEINPNQDNSQPAAIDDESKSVHVEAQITDQPQHEPKSNEQNIGQPENLTHESQGIISQDQQQHFSSKTDPVGLDQDKNEGYETISRPAAHTENPNTPVNTTSNPIRNTINPSQEHDTVLSAPENQDNISKGQINNISNSFIFQEPVKEEKTVDAQQTYSNQPGTTFYSEKRQKEETEPQKDYFSTDQTIKNKQTQTDEVVSPHLFETETKSTSFEIKKEKSQEEQKVQDGISRSENVEPLSKGQSMEQKPWTINPSVQKRKDDQNQGKSTENATQPGFTQPPNQSFSRASEIGAKKEEERDSLNQIKSKLEKSGLGKNAIESQHDDQRTIEKQEETQSDQLRLAGKKPGEKLEVTSDKLVKTVFNGHHDRFETTLYHAAFGSVEETDLYHGYAMTQNESFLNSVRAANTLAATELALSDAKFLMSTLSAEQMVALKKVMKATGCGELDFSDIEKYEASMENFHKYLTHAGVLEKRSVSKSGSLLYAQAAEKKIYQGNIFDKSIVKAKQKLARKAELKQTKNFKNPQGIANRTAVKGKKIKTKDIKNIDRTKDILKKDFGTAGLTGEDIEGLVTFFYKNGVRFATTSRIMKTSQIGRNKILTLNPLKNALITKGMKEDPNARYIFKTQSMISGTKSVFHAGQTIVKAMHQKEMAKLASALNAVDKKMKTGGLDEGLKAKLKKQQEKLTKRKSKLLTREKRWEKTENAFSKVETTLIKKPLEKIKRPFKAVNQKAKKLANRIPGVKRVVNFKWTSFVHKHQMLGKVVSFLPKAFATVIGKLVTVVLMPVLIAIAIVFLIMLLISIICGLILCFVVLVNSFWTGEPGANDAEFAENIAKSTMGAIYHELQLEEIEWANNLVHSADDEIINVKDIKYTKIDEGTGTIDETYRNIDASTYIRDIVGLEYDSESDRVKTPAPWDGAPEEACYTVDGTITGGVELRYIGTGGYPGYTSNIMEIIAMASVANDESTLEEYEEDELSDASDTSFIGTIHNFASGCIKKLKFLEGIVSGFANKIVSAIPGGNAFLEHNATKTRTKSYFSYVKPLFNISHQTAYGLEFSFLPTDRTLMFSGANTINQFNSALWSGEGYAGVEEVEDSEIPRATWAFFKAHGFDDYHIAGIMGNFYQESRFNVNSEMYPGKSTGPIGIAQWLGGRRKKLESYALAITGSPQGWKNNLQLQLTFLMTGDEPDTISKYLSQTFTSSAAAAIWWGTYWERFNIQDGSMPTRSAAAVRYYEIYAGQDVDVDSGNDSTGSLGMNTSAQEAMNTTKYSHTPNVNDDGSSYENYDNNLQYKDSVTIPGAKTLKVEIWYATQNRRDWLSVRSKEEGELTTWDKPSVTYSGGNQSSKPSDSSSQHVTKIIGGDTVHFAFYSNSRINGYGYYAVITADEVDVDTSWLDEQIESTSQMPSILINANVCTGHNGHGCQSYSHFGYDDTTRKFVEYNGKRIETIYPAALDVEESGEYACNAPSGKSSEFYEAIDHNKDCWVLESTSSANYKGRGLSSRGSSDFFDSETEYGYTASGNSHSFTVTLTTDEWKERDDDDDWEWYHTNETRVYTHKCNQSHTGYYCGGHMRLIIYGVIYHMSTAERNYKHDLYTEKSLGVTYEKDHPKSFFTDETKLVNTEMVNKANDLFDLDNAIYHIKGTISKEFEGWSYDYVDVAAIKLEDDWYDLYGLNTSWTVNGYNGSASGSGVAITMNSEELAKIKAAVKSQYPHDNTDKTRDQAIETALKYVGKIGYNQAYHGSKLQEGGYNDCSGYVSQVYNNVLRRIYSTDGFKDLAVKYGAYRNFTDGNCKPGDILLRGMENSNKKDNHALLYLGKIDGEDRSVDCSTSGGVGNVFYRTRGVSYYNTCTYIDMTVFIQGYIAEHPDMAGNLLPES